METAEMARSCVGGGVREEVVWEMEKVDLVASGGLVGT